VLAILAVLSNCSTHEDCSDVGCSTHEDCSDVGCSTHEDCSDSSDVGSFVPTH
jgi:hypothetical protein